MNVAELIEFVLVTLAKLIDRDGSYVRDRALSTAWISDGHIRTTIVDVAERPPWSVLLGDHVETLRDLREACEPENLTSYKIWCVAKSGCRPDAEMFEAFELGLDLYWTNNEAERQHSRMATMKRLHPDYALDTVLA